MRGLASGPDEDATLHWVNHLDRKEAGRHRPPAEGGDAPPGADDEFVEGDGEEPAEGPP